MGKERLSSKLMNCIGSFDSSLSFDINEDTAVLEPEVIDIDEFQTQVKETKKEKRNNSRDKDDLEDLLDRGSELIRDMYSDDMIYEFDSFLDSSSFLDEEDTEMKNQLIQAGRKYARDTKVTGESSEIAKAYAKTEKMLSDLADEVKEDTSLIQKDITSMRMMRVRNPKALSELLNTKAQFHSTTLNIAKEMNAITKNKFDLQAKADKSKKEAEGDGSTANLAIQKLFSVGRDSILNGGYEEISGAYDMHDEDVYDPRNIPLNRDVDDEVIQRKYFNSDDDEYETDGDKFLKYEGLGVHYILLYDDNNQYEIIAEDKNGNLIPDYPLPSNPDELNFDISYSTNTATDNLANQYELRHM